jgi:polyhydroxybutyrate depolymerase
MRRMHAFAAELFIAVAFVSILCSCGGNSSSTNTSNTSTNISGGLGCVPGQDPACKSIQVKQSDGTTVQRTYAVHVPANFVAGSSALVVALHAGGQNGEGYETWSELDSTADLDGFAVAYPDGSQTDPSLGVGLCWNFFYSTYYGSSTPPDDSAFLRQMIVSLESSLQPNPKKIYVTGLSCGGLMAHRAAVELSDLVAAAGVISGWLYRMPVNSPQSVPPAKSPISVLMLHGDTNNEYCGDPPGVDPTTASCDIAFNYWAGPNGDNCTTLDTTQPLCDLTQNLTAVIEKDASGCAGNTEVKFYRLVGAGHTTPMNNIDISQFNSNLNATTGTHTNDVLWNFFAAHPKQ